VCVCVYVCVCLMCSYLNTEVVKKCRQCKVNVDFYKIGIEYEGARTEVGEVSTCQCCLHSQIFSVTLVSFSSRK